MAIPSVYFGTGKKYHSVALSAAGTIALPVRLSKPATEEVQVGIALSGSRTIYGDTPEYGTAWVGGPGHTLSAATVTFAVGDVSKSVDLDVVERKTTDSKHIPFIPEGLRATLSIPEASTGKVRAGSVGYVLDVIVSDDLIEGVFNVKDYGAVGDGVTKDQAAIEAAIAAAAASISNQTTQQAIVYFPRGTYRIYMDLTFIAAITLVGQDRDTTIIKRLDRSAFVNGTFADEWTLAFLVSGITVKPAVGTIYQDSIGNKFKTYSTTYISGTAGILYMSHVPDGSLPPESGTLTKVGSGDGDASVSYSGVSLICARFTVSGVSITPAVGVSYTHNSDTYQLFYAAIAGGSGSLFFNITNGSSGASGTGTLTKTGGGTGDATISFSDSTCKSPSAISMAVTGVTETIEAGAVYGIQGWSATVNSVDITNGTGWLNIQPASSLRYGPPRAGTLTKASGVGQAAVTFSDWIGYGRWWAKMIEAGDDFSNADHSSISGFRNITVDGNAEAFPEYLTIGSLVYEPSHAVMLSPGDSAGQYRFLVENTLFTNKISSQVATASNSNFMLYNSRLAPDGNPGKGVWSLVGGNNDQEIRQSSVGDPGVAAPESLNMEQNTAADGFYDDSRFSLLVEDSVIHGNFQLGGHLTATGAQTVTIRRSQISDIAPVCQKADVLIEDNCVISPVGYGDISLYTMISRAKSFLVQDCTINIGPHQPEEPWFAGISWNFPEGVSEYKFKNVTFQVVGTHSYGGARCFNNNRYNDQNLPLTPVMGKLILEDCSFDGFDCVVYPSTGGYIEIIRPVLTNCDRFISTYGTADYPFEITITGPVTLNGAVYLTARQASTLVPANKITHTLDGGAATVILPVADCLIMSGQAASAGTGIRGFTYAGKRQITGTGNPNLNTAITGLPGDEFYNGSAYYDCVAENDGNESAMGYLKVIDGVTYLPTTWTLRV